MKCRPLDWYTPLLAVALAFGASCTMAAAAPDKPTKPRQSDEAAEALRRQDYETAFRIYRPLAKRGNADAQFNLGMIYDNGLGIAPDKAEAVRWYSKAARQDFAMAQYNLGTCY